MKLTFLLVVAAGIVQATPIINGITNETNISNHKIEHPSGVSVSDIPSIPNSSFNALKIKPPDEISDIFGKKVHNSLFIELLTRSSGGTQRDVYKKVMNSIKAYRGEEKVTNCEDKEERYSGLCSTGEKTIIYKNTDRVSNHLIRSYFIPTAALGTKASISVIRFLTCNFRMGIFRLVNGPTCLALKWTKPITNLIFNGLAIISYEIGDNRPFSKRAVDIINLNSMIGRKTKFWKGVAENGTVVDLNKIPSGFDLKYVYTEYGTPKTAKRNNTMVIFPGNKQSELGLSLISKPWVNNSQNTNTLKDKSIDFAQYDWKYVLSIDTDKVQYMADKVSPEELLYRVQKYAEKVLAQYLYTGGGMLSENHTIVIDPSEFGEKREDDSIKKEIIDEIDAYKESIFDLRKAGFVIRVSIEEKAEHTVRWG